MVIINYLITVQVKFVKICRLISNNFFIAKLIFKASPWFVLLTILNAIRNEGLIYLEHTYAISFILESVEFGRSSKEVLRFLIILSGVMILSGIYSTIYENYLKPICMPKIKQNFKEIMYQKAKSLDLEYYDNPDNYNDYVLAVKESENSVERMLDLLNTVVGSVTIIVCYGTFFALKDITSVFFVLLSFILSIAFQKKLSQVNYDIKIKRNAIERKRDYIGRVFYLNAYAKELRLNKAIYPILYKKYDDSNNEIKDVVNGYKKKKFKYELLAGYLSGDFIMDVIYISYLVYKAAVLKLISYSSVVVLYNSSGNLRRGFINIKEFFAKFIDMSLYVEKIRAFLACESKLKQEGEAHVDDSKYGFVFKNVTFSYNKMATNILNGLNLSIEPNQKVAIVGCNGAGKTTLIKLLLRLYDVDSGTIFYGDKNINEYDLEDYRRNIGVVFQDFQMFAVSLGENVVMDRMKDEDRDAVYSTIKKSGLEKKMNNLDKGIDTPITKEFWENGTELSGGEKQKLAIARGYYRDAKLIILDEPSSALDPVSEYNLNEFIFKTASDKTVVFISHRLSTTRKADKIYVIDDGKVVEEGTHKELLKKGEKYAEMWFAQAAKYSSIVS